MTAYLNRCIWLATSSGTGSFVENTAVLGYQTMESAGSVDQQTYSYAAQSTDLTQWEYGNGVWTAATKTLTRVVVGNSLGTTAAVNFTAPPQVLIGTLASMLGPPFVVPSTESTITLDGIASVFQSFNSNYEWGLSNIKFGNDASGAAIGFAKTRGATSGTQTIVQNADVCSITSVYGSDGTQYRPLGLTQWVVDGAPTAGVSVPGRYEIFTVASGSSTPTLQLSIDNTGVVTITDTTGSSSTTTGALIVGGGLGVGDNIYAGGGTIQVSGATNVFMLLVAPNNNYSATLRSSNFSRSWDFGSASAGHALGDNFYIFQVGTGAAMFIAGTTNNVSFTSTTASTTPTTGSVLVAGGAGVAGALCVGGSLVMNTAAIATTATDGFVYIATCAGTPTGTPTAFTGRVPMVFDTTNSQFWIYTGGAWKQPKTPAGAALVTWQ